MIVLRILTTESVYFLQKLKPYSVEGVQNVSFYTVQNFLIHRRGNHQLVTFTSKSKNHFASWMESPELTQEFHDNLADFAS